MCALTRRCNHTADTSSESLSKKAKLRKVLLRKCPGKCACMYEQTYLNVFLVLPGSLSLCLGLLGIDTLLLSLVPDNALKHL